MKLIYFLSQVISMECWAQFMGQCPECGVGRGGVIYFFLFFFILVFSFLCDKIATRRGLVRYVDIY